MTDSPTSQAMHLAMTELRERELRIAELEKALSRIARWHGEFPATGQEWEPGRPVSYGAQYGSNGERDYMRQIALDALNKETNRG